MEKVCEEYGVRERVESMMLSKLLDGVVVTKMFQTMYGQMVVTHDVEVGRVHYDSRRVKAGDMFVAIHGAQSDGHTYIKDAVDNGAKVVLMEKDDAMPDAFFMHNGVVKIVVANGRIALAQIASNFFNQPSRSLTMVGVTGTNGKTTTTNLIRSVLEQHGGLTGLIGTIEHNIGGKVIPATHTTPESLELQELLRNMVESGCTSAVMEVSSHALHQHRVDGLEFKVAVFTNLTQDHLDYHGTMEEYFIAKKILFEELQPSAFAVINMDDAWGKRMTEATRSRVLSYGTTTAAEVRAIDIRLSMKEIRFTLVYGKEQVLISSSLIGRFNVYNILAASAAGIALQIPLPVIQQAILQTKNVRGRFEQISSPDGWTAIIDYAHTPDALEKALIAVHDVFDSSVRGRIITVFGCGGNRDRRKRPVMAEVATRLSDVTIITSDNPRNEQPDAIVDEIMVGVRSGATVRREVDRRQAIALALGLAQGHDVVLVAGKGHEEYQIIGNERIHFSDREAVEEFIRSHA